VLPALGPFLLGAKYGRSAALVFPWPVDVGLIVAESGLENGQCAGHIRRMENTIA
jgi:hypothetical protein